MSDVLEVRGLHKAYGNRQAVDGVTLTVHAGEVLGLLGPNGAGKSTTVGMISGTTEPDAGSITIAGAAVGADADSARRRLGLVAQELALYDELPARDNVCLFGALYGLAGARLDQRTAEALAQVGPTDRARERPATFSGDMKRRLNIACALVHDPDVLLLDEPTAGVDPQSRNAIFEHLEQLKRAGKALVYTTHHLEEVERLADRIVIIDRGRVAAWPRGRVAAQGTLAEPLGMLPGAAHAQGGRPGLEDVFLALTGRQLRD